MIMHAVVCAIITGFDKQLSLILWGFRSIAAMRKLCEYVLCVFNRVTELLSVILYLQAGGLST